MTKREDSWVRVLLIALVGVTITVVWELHASDRVQASQIHALEAVVPMVAAEVTQTLDIDPGPAFIL